MPVIAGMTDMEALRRRRGSPDVVAGPLTTPVVPSALTPRTTVVAVPAARCLIPAADGRLSDEGVTEPARAPRGG